MAKKMKAIAGVSLVLTIFFALIYKMSGSGGGIFLTGAVTFGTVTYHFLMRLFVGFVFDVTLNNRVDYHQKWFQVNSVEQRLYKKLKVKKWKIKMPTYDPCLLYTSDAADEL